MDNVALDTRNPNPAATTASALSMPELAMIHRNMIQSHPPPYLPDNLLMQEIFTINTTFNIHEPTITDNLSLTGIHPTLGLATKDETYITDTVRFTSCKPGTIAHKTLQTWKS